MNPNFEDSVVGSLAANLDNLHSVGLLNKLAKAKHQRLHTQIVQIEGLLKRAEDQRIARQQEYSKRFTHYEQTIRFLEAETGRKDELIKKLEDQNGSV